MKVELNPIKKLKVYLGLPYLIKASGVSSTTWHNWDNAGGCPANRIKAVLGIAKGVVTESELLESSQQIEFKVKK